MSAITKPATFSDSRKSVLHYRNFSQKLKSAFVELGAWALSFALFFAVIEVVIWVAAINVQ